MSLLDSLIRYLRLSSLDEHDPRVTHFAPRTAPVVSTFPPQHRHRDPAEFVAAQQSGSLPHPPNVPAKCLCANYTLGSLSRDTVELAPLWSHTAGWLAQWTEGDIRREECRRLIWSSVILIAGYASYNTATGKLLPELALMDPSNVSASTGQAAARADTAAGRGALPWRVDLLAWWAAFEGHCVGAIHALAPALERLRAYAQ